MWNEDYLNADTDINKYYHGEIESLIREQLFPPGTDLKTNQLNAVLRRGPRSKQLLYGTGVHQDFAYTFEHYKEFLSAFGATDFNALDENFKNCEIFTVICFWRPIHMAETTKLINNPLAVLDCNSVKKEDIVKTKSYGFTPVRGKYLPQLTLKHSDEQKWCYYPDMKVDEVLAFKQFYVRKSDPNGDYKGCFHTAFKDPREGIFNFRQQIR